MITNPYEVLGVSPQASNDEIKKAYRDICKKYHPDSYVGNPLSDLAEDKFKEAQQAYEQIMNDRERGYERGGEYSGSSGDDVQLMEVYNYLTARRYSDALKVLSGIANRSARWYYFSSVANAGVGNNMIAIEHGRQAVNMEPGNQEYAEFLNRLEWQGQRYQGARMDRGSIGTGNICCDLWCADSCCECMGGDLCSCI